MNSYQNTNEYEILDASQNNFNMSNRYRRYPLANDPQASMQNTNYKDWLTMCDSNTQFVGDISKYSSFEAYISAKAAIGFGAGLVSTILSIFSGPISLVIGTIIGVTTAVLDFLPTNEDNTSPIWAYLIDHVKELIRDAIDTEAVNRAQSILNGLTQVIDDYNGLLDQWKDKNATGEEMADELRSTHDIFLAEIPRLQQLGHQVSFLPLFAVAASLHLLLLRDASVYGEKWGMSSGLIDNLYNGPQGQLTKTKQYTDYALKVYKEGLEQSKKVAVSNSNNFNWENYNQYRKNMTLTVLDVIALFPTYDNHIYNMSTKVQLTRDVYTDLISYIKNPFLTNPVEGGKFEGYTQSEFNAIENALIRPPHLFTWLKEITGYSYQQYGLSRFFSAMQNKYYYTFGNGIITGPIHGPRYSGDTPYSITLTDYQDIYSTLSYMIPLSYSYDVVRDLEFGSALYYGVTSHLHDITDRRTGNTTQKILGEDTARDRATVRAVGPSSVRSEIPYKVDEPPTAEKYSHRLSYISAYATDCGANSVRPDRGCRRTPQLCAWTHVSVDNNTIYPDKITQIPAVKAFDISDAGPSQVIAGPGHTGGDVVKLYISGRLKIRLTPASTYKNYLVRVRYASPASGTLRVERWSPSSVTNRDFTRSATGGFDSFGYVDTLVTTFYQSGVEIIIQNLGASDVIIDRVEFIPIDIPIIPTDIPMEKNICKCDVEKCDCRGVQSLEKEKEIVNSLFVK